jgi:DNA helicase HerA-like ATPase
MEECNELNRMSLSNHTYRSIKVLTGGSLLRGFCVEYSSFLIFPAQDIIKVLEQLQPYASVYSTSKNYSST